MSEPALRMAEAILFQSAKPISEAALAARLPDGCDVPAIVARLRALYDGRGVELREVAGGWAFRTAADLGHLFTAHRVSQRRLSRAALETLAIVAYHQPVTRAEIEDIRGVSVSKGTLDTLMEIGWLRIRGRRRVPGRPLTFGVTNDFLDHFGLSAIGDLPGLDELRAAGFLSRDASAAWRAATHTDADEDDEDAEAADSDDSDDSDDGQDSTADGPGLRLVETPALGDGDGGIGPDPD